MNWSLSVLLIVCVLLEVQAVLRPQPTANLAGKVVDEQGQPVAGELIHLQQWGWDSATTTTATDGSFEFTADPGHYWLVLESDRGGAHVFNWGYDIEVKTNEAILDFQYVKRARTTMVRGKIQDTNGNGIEGVAVGFWLGNDRQTYTYTDPSGDYFISVFAGSYRIQFNANNKGYLNTPVRQLEAKNALETADFTLARANVPLSGRIMFDTGEAMTNVSVEAARLYSPERAMDWFQSEPANALGEYSLKVGEGEWRIGISDWQAKEAMAASIVRTFTFTNEVGREIDLVFPRLNSAVEGFLQTETGEPVTNILISLTSEYQGAAHSDYIRTDSTGHFRVALFDGAWTASVSNYDLNQRGLRAPPAITFQVRSETNNLTLTAARPTHEVTGTVRLGDGSPLVGLTVGAYMAGETFRTVSDEQGNFRIELFPGEWAVFVDDTERKARNLLGPYSWPLEVPEQGSTNIDLTLYEGNALVTGTLKDTKGTAITNIFLSFISQADPSLRYSLNTRDDGSFEVQLYSGAWRVQMIQWELNRRGYLASSEKAVTVTGGTNLLELTVELAEIVVSGLLLKDDGTPVTNMVITASQWGEGVYNIFSSTSLVPGEFSLNLGPGPWNIYADAQLAKMNGVRPVGTHFILTNGINLRTNLVFPRLSSTISGSVKTEQGIALTNISIALQKQELDNYSENVRTDENGEFSIAVVDGRWRVAVASEELNAAGLGAPPAQILVLSNEIKRADFVAVTPKLSISGTVRDDLGAPVTNITLFGWSWSQDTHQRFSTVTDERGQFLLGAFEGEWSLQFDEQELRGRRLLFAPVPSLSVKGTNAIRDLTLRSAPYSIVISLRDEEGLPVKGQVHAVSFIENSIYSSHLGVDGTAEIMAAAGLWRVEVWLHTAGNLYPPLEPQVVRVASNSTEVVFIARKWVKDSVIKGKVFDPDGRPVANLGLRAEAPWGSEQVQTDLDGAFTLQTSRGHLRIIPDENVLQERGMISSSVAFEIFRGGTYEKNILLRRASSDLRLKFQFAGHDLSWMPGWFSVSTEWEGALFMYENQINEEVRSIPLFPGVWKLSANAGYPPEFRRITDQPIDVIAGQQEVVVVLQSLEPSASIVGRVVDETGAAWALPEMYAEDRAGGYWTNAVGNANGTFTIPVHGGDWHVGAFRSGLGNSVLASVGDGLSVDVGTIVLPRTNAVLELSFFTSEGKQIAPSSVELGHTDARGTFRAYSQWWNSVEPAFALFAGEWEIKVPAYELWRWGYAAIQPLKVEVRTGENKVRLVAERLKNEANPPWFTFGKSRNIPELRLHTEDPGSLMIEGSEDMRSWKVVKKEFPATGYIELDQNSLSNSFQFYRGRFSD